jgi:HPt (histidine-containing phosphotransfer) domain-containing protein
MKGDRERCLAAGMDAYLPKPVRSSELITLIESLAQAGEPARPSMPTSTVLPKAAAPRDFSAALERLAGDQDLLKRQMKFFLDDAPGLLEDMRTSITAGDRDSLKIAAHRLKGLAASYDAHAAAELALRLEGFAGHAGDSDLALAEPIAGELGGCIDDLLLAIQEYLSES